MLRLLNIFNVEDKYTDQKEGKGDEEAAAAAAAAEEM